MANEFGYDKKADEVQLTSVVPGASLTGGGTWARTSERGQGRRMRGGTGVPARASTSPPGRKQPKRGNRRAAVGMAGAGDRTTAGGGRPASPGFRVLPLPGHPGLVCQSEGLAGAQGCVCAYAFAHPNTYP